MPYFGYDVRYHTRVAHVIPLIVTIIEGKGMVVVRRSIQGDDWKLEYAGSRYKQPTSPTQRKEDF